jgi:signal peptidase II
MKRTVKFFLIALGIVALDQTVKLLVKLNMSIGDSIPVIGDFFRIYFIENKGAAFGLTVTHLAGGLGIEMSEETGKLILSLFSLAAVVAIGVVLYRLADHQSPLPYFVAMIFGGAIGNIVDRTFYGLWFSSINEYEGGLLHGRVVDMFFFDLWDGQIPAWVPLIGGDYTSTPIFNIADSAISVGIVIILIFQGRFFRMDEKARAAAPAVAVAAAGTAAAVTAHADGGGAELLAAEGADSADDAGTDTGGQDSGADSGGGGDSGGGDGGGD